MSTKTPIVPFPSTEPPIAPSKGWYQIGESENTHLPALLTVASDNYVQQTEWFLRHRDTGIRHLMAILAAESTITGLYFTTHKQIPLVIISIVLGCMMFLAVLFALYAIRSCERSYRASLEHCMLMAKITWALGLHANVVIKNDRCGKCPAPDDPFLYVPRFVNNATEDQMAWTTEVYTYGL